MARTRLPDPLQRRHWLEQDLDAARARRTAEAFQERGRTMEALLFFHKAGDRERLAALRDEAVAAGDVFLFREICARLEEEPDSDTWRALAEAAAAAGKDLYAAEAERQLTAREG